MFYLRSGKLKVGHEFCQFSIFNLTIQIPHGELTGKCTVHSHLILVKSSRSKALRYAGGHFGFKCTAEAHSWVYIAVGAERRENFFKITKHSLSVWEETFFILAFWFSVSVCTNQTLWSEYIIKEVLWVYGVMDALVKFEEQSRNASLVLFKLNECIQNSIDIRTPSTNQFLINMGYK